MSDSDRVGDIATEADPSKRADRYFAIEDATREGARPKLSLLEIKSLLDAISAEKARRPLIFAWRLALQQDPSDEIRRFCEDWLKDAHRPQRADALQYLRERYPSECDHLISMYSTDPNPSVRYQAALCLLGKAPERAMDAIVDLLPSLPLELREEAEMYLLESGNEYHVNRLRQNDDLLGGGTAAGRFAEELAHHLASRH